MDTHCCVDAQEWVYLCKACFVVCFCVSAFIYFSLYRKLKGHPSIYIKQLNQLIPWRLIRYYERVYLCRRIPRSAQFVVFLIVVVVINLLIFSYLYRYPSIRVDEEQKNFIAVRSGVKITSTPVALFNNYPHITGLSSISLNHCHRKMSWPAWNRGVVTRMSPPIEANCPLLWKGDKNEKSRVKTQLSSWKNSISDSHYYSHYLTNCSAIQAEFSNFYISQEEKNFPIAFLMNIHTSLQQVVRFLKVIYRPHNTYCVHIDKKSSSLLKHSFEVLSKCLPNFIVARKTYNVLYETIDQVDALRSCYSELLDQKAVAWKYAILLCGREIPMKTNRELVRILRGMQGANVVNPGVLLHDRRVAYDMRRRILYRVSRHPIVRFSTEPLDPVPHDIRVYKNHTFNALTPEFVHFLFTNEKAADFYLFLRDTRYPDEQYFTSLNHLPEAPGGHSMLVTNNLLDKLPQVAMAYWVGVHNYIPKVFTKLYYPDLRCQDGHQVHFVCIATISDLLHIQTDTLNYNVMFFNKYLEEFDHVVMDCAEEELLKRNRLEYYTDCKHATSQL